MLYYPEKDQQAIVAALNHGLPLIVCMCAAWCNNCEEWRAVFEEAARENSHTGCFVWLDIDEHFDMVTEVDLETLPVLLIHHREGVAFLGTFRPDKSTLLALIRGSGVSGRIDDPGIRDFLTEPL